MYVYSGAGWQAAGSSVNGTSDRQTYTASSGQTVFAATYDTGYIDVYLNGVKLVAGTDFTATNGTSITLASGATINDVIDIVAYGTFVLADHYTEAQSDARFVQQTHTGNVDITGDLSFGDNNKAIFGAGSDLQIYHDGGSDSYITHSGSNGLGISAPTISLTDNVGRNMLRGVSEGATTLYHNNSEKLATTATGIDVTGTVVADGLTVDGNVGIGSSTANHFSIAGTANVLGVKSSSGALVSIAATGTNFSGIDLGTDSLRRAGMYSLNGSVLGFYTNPTNSGTGLAERMSIDSSGNVGIGTSSPAANAKLHVAKSADGGVAEIILENSFTNAGSSTDEITQIQGRFGGYDASYITTGKEGDFTTAALRKSYLAFSTRTATTGITEKVRIDSSGNVGIGISNPSDYYTNFNDLVLGSTSTHSGMTIASGTSHDGTIAFADGTSGDAEYKGYIQYNHTNNAFGIGTNGVEAIGIDSSGHLIAPYGITLGTAVGTYAAANTLDDYEEGTWSVSITPSSSGTITITGGAFYTKVGQIVNINISVNSTAVSSPVGYLDVNLPFAASTGTQKGRSAVSLYFDGIAAGHNTADFVGLTIDGTSSIRIYIGDGPGNSADSAQAIDGDSYMLISGTYITSA
jgi:hypothetical protein